MGATSTGSKGSIGSKSAGWKGKWGGKKSGGNVLPDSTLISVTLTAGVARSLLSSLTSGNPPPQATAKSVALALVRALNTGGGGKKKKGGNGKKGAPKGNGKNRRRTHRYGEEGRTYRYGEERRTPPVRGRKARRERGRREFALRGPFGARRPIGRPGRRGAIPSMVDTCARPENRGALCLLGSLRL